MKITRRRFIKTSIAAVGGIMLGTHHLLASCANTKKSPFYNPYELVDLGKTGLRPSRLCMGTGIFGGNGESNLTRLGFEQGVSLVRQLYEKGVRMYDCADSYGSHFIVGEALKSYPRDSYVVFTKVWFRGVKDLDMNAAVVRFMKELQTDYVDGIQLHCAAAADWTTEAALHMEVMDKLKQKGIIRSHGVSCHSLDALRTAAREPWVDTCHVRINPFGVNMDDTFENVVPVIRQLKEAGKGVIGMKIFGEGKFAQDPEKKNQSLTFALQSGLVDVMTIGMDKISDLLDTEERIRKVPRV